MQLRFNVGKLHFFASVTVQSKVKGICSRIKDSDEHVLFWDFDDLELEEVLSALCKVSDWFGLPRIVVLQTSGGNHFHAYCFRRTPFAEAMYILASTPGIDMVFFKLGVLRGYWTLRISSRGEDDFKVVAELNTNLEWDVSPLELENVNEYWTRKRK